MVIEEKVQELLEADASVIAECPADRIGVPNDRQTETRPYIQHFAVDPDPTYTHEGRISLTGWTYQISCFADTYREARELSVLVRAAVEGVRGQATFFWRSQTYIDEAVNEVRVHQIALTFEVFEAL